MSRPAPAQTPVLVALAGLAALAVAMGIGRFAFTPILPMMQEDAGLDVIHGGWLASANYLGYLLGALWAAAKRVRAAVAIRASLAAIGLSTLAMGLTDSFVLWCVLRLIAGAASAWALIQVSSWCLERLALLGRPMLGGTVFAGVGTGIAVAGMICLALMHMRASSAQAWVVLGVLALAVTVLLLPVIGTRAAPVGGPKAGPPPAPQSWYRDADALKLVVCYGIYGFGYIIPATFVPAMARQAIPDPAVFGWSWPVFGAAAALSTLLAAAMSRVIGKRRLWMLCHLIMAVGVAVPALWTGIAGIMIAALCVGGTFMAVTLVALQEARALVETNAGTNATGLIAAMTAAFAAGQIAGPLSVGWLGHLPAGLLPAGGEFSAALLFASLLLTASAVALAWPARHPSNPA